MVYCGSSSRGAQALSALHTLLIVTALGILSAAPGAQPRRVTDESGINGYVLTPDGTPVSDGSVVALSPVRLAAAIDRTGHFRLVPDAAGLHRLLVTIPGFAPSRVNVTVPPSMTMTLPVIRVSAATYFRARFVSSSGEPLLFPSLLRQSFDADGFPITYPLDEPAPDRIESDGTVTIGPLPRGLTTSVLDSPPYARTRLRDLHVTGAETLLDGETVTIQDGAVLEVDVLDATGAPVPAHNVSLEDAVPLSPILMRSARTDQQGRAIFDRVGAGRYRLRTRAAGECGNSPLLVGRPVAVSGAGAVRTRIVVTGNATFRVTSPLGALRGVAVAASPESGPPIPSPALRSASGLPHGTALRLPPPPSCGGNTDRDGRVVLTNFPPGPARVTVRLLNSTFVQRVSVPQDGREIPISVPDGFLPLRITDSRTKQPVAGAQIAWTARTARVEVTASASGEALLEGVGRGAGKLAITARGYQPGEASLSEPPAMLMEVALTPRAIAGIRPLVVASTGIPLPNAVVQLISEDALAVPRVAVTGQTGVAEFDDVAAGAFRILARADGFVPAALRIAEEARDRVVLTLSRGYRVAVTVDSSSAAGPYFLRVLDANGASMDGLLDSASDRRLDARGRVSLGPLPRGTYVIELHGASERRQQRADIVDRDISLVVS